MKGVKTGCRTTIHGRTCTKCGKWRRWKFFCIDKGGHNGRHSRCKTCCAEASAEWKSRTDYYNSNQKRLLDYKRATYCPSRKKSYDLFFKYGLTFAQYDSLYRRQKGKCKICRKRILKHTTLKTKMRSATVDHD